MENTSTATQMTKEQILAAYEYRHATKEFDSSRKISGEDFGFILETGRLSPSSFGFEPWKFVVVQNPELRQKLLPYAWGAQKQLPTASHFVLILARQPRDLAADSEYIQSMMSEVQKLPVQIAEGKQRVFGAFLKNDFGLAGNERAIFEWGRVRRICPLAI